MDNHFQDSHDHGHEHGHSDSLLHEIVCHLPYAIFSVAFGLTILSFMSYWGIVSQVSDALTCKASRILFHSFHFMHIVFAATGAIITYFRFSKNVIKGLLVGAFSAIVFCTLSDVILPYIGGMMLGVNMSFHLCFWSELHNIVPFLFVGLLNGYVMSRNREAQQGHFSLFSHFVHILISSFASMFYLVSHGFTSWCNSIGPVFLFLVIAVVVPCTLSDVVVPMAFARAGKKNEKH